MKQYELADFLKNYDTVLFDMDGVVTSESAYWDSASLTVYEMYYGADYYGNKSLNVSSISSKLTAIRDKIFCNDRTIKLIKNKGVNSNWDLAYVVLGMALTLGENADFNIVYNEIESAGKTAFDLYDTIAERLSKRLKKDKAYFERLSDFWQIVKSCFQEWYLGEDGFKSTYKLSPRLSGKKGFISAEKPLVDHNRLIELLNLLKSHGKRLGIGTGRPEAESVPVLKSWGALDFFANDAIITYDDVIRAEKELLTQGIDTALTKPHPFMFLKGNFGDSLTAFDIINNNFDKSFLNRTLVVGDAGADLFSARAAGFDFAAVLTGVSGDAARSFFEKENATYILNNVLELMVEK